MLNKIFIYDDVLLPKTQNILSLKPIDKRIVEAQGKLYMIHRTPIMLKLNDVTYNRGMRKVFGAIYTFEPDQMEKVLYSLDNYKGCSLSRIGLIHPYDLTHRSTIQAYPIKFKNIHEFETFRYQYGKPEECYVYLGNPKHETIIYNVKINRHNKLSNGYYKKGFIDLLKQGGYING